MQNKRQSPFESKNCRLRCKNKLSTAPDAAKMTTTQHNVHAPYPKTPTHRCKKHDVTITNNAPCATTPHELTTPENDQNSLDVAEARDSTAHIAIDILSTESHVTSKVVNICAQNRCLKRHHVLKASDKCRHEPSDPNKLLRKFLPDLSTNRKEY